MPSPSQKTSAAEWWYLFCTLWFVTGLAVDGHAHVHFAELESFFTPWHAIFYSGFAVSALTLLVWKLRGSLPAAYRWSLWGAAIFLLGGVGDMTWHIVFGVEADIEALLSPTHLLLAVGMILMISGPLWSGIRRNTPWFAVAGLILTLFVPLFMTQFGNFTDPPIYGLEEPEGALWDYQQSIPVFGVVWLSVVLLGGLSILLRTKTLPSLGVTAVTVALFAAFANIREGTDLIPAALVGGLMGDWLAMRARRMNFPNRNLRQFFFGLPVALYAGVFLTIRFTEGTWWSVHMWAGAPVFAGMAGLLLSYVLWPPKMLEK